EEGDLPAHRGLLHWREARVVEMVAPLDVDLDERRIVVTQDLRGIEQAVAILLEARQVGGRNQLDAIELPERAVEAALALQRHRLRFAGCTCDLPELAR